MRTDLSPSTWIEDSYIYTRSVEVAAAWMGDYLEASANGSWQYEWRISSIGAWRLPLTAAREVYRYREGEPFCHEYRMEVICCDSPAYAKAHQNFPGSKPLLHLRAVIACGGSADSLRALAGAYAPVGQGE